MAAGYGVNKVCDDMQSLLRQEKPDELHKAIITDTYRRDIHGKIIESHSVLAVSVR